MILLRLRFHLFARAIIEYGTVETVEAGGTFTQALADSGGCVVRSDSRGSVAGKQRASRWILEDGESGQFGSLQRGISSVSHYI